MKKVIKFVMHLVFLLFKLFSVFMLMGWLFIVGFREVMEKSVELIEDGNVYAQYYPLVFLVIALIWIVYLFYKMIIKKV